MAKGYCACGCGRFVDFGDIEVAGSGFVASEECEMALMEMEADREEG